VAPVYQPCVLVSYHSHSLAYLVTYLDSTCQLSVIVNTPVTLFIRGWVFELERLHGNEDNGNTAVMRSVWSVWMGL